MAFRLPKGHKRRRGFYIWTEHLILQIRKLSLISGIQRLRARWETEISRLIRRTNAGKKNTALSLMEPGQVGPMGGILINELGGRWG